MRGGKKDSHMGDVGIIKNIDIPELKAELIAVFDSKSLEGYGTGCCYSSCEKACINSFRLCNNFNKFNVS